MKHTPPEAKFWMYTRFGTHIALCSYHFVKWEIGNSSPILITAPIFLQSNYFRQSIWVQLIYKYCIARLFNSCQYFGIWQREKRMCSTLCTHCTLQWILSTYLRTVFTFCSSRKCLLDLRSTVANLERDGGERFGQLRSTKCHQGYFRRDKEQILIRLERQL